MHAKRIAVILTGIVIALLETDALFMLPLSYGMLTKIMIGASLLTAVNTLFAFGYYRNSIESFFIPTFFFVTIFLMHGFLLPLLAYRFWSYLEIANLAIIVYAGITTAALLVIITVLNAISSKKITRRPSK
jgi:hypothetical protein